MTTADPPDRLDSWKEIAAYLRRDVRTAQRWEKKEGLPVHRHQHDKLGSIYAYKSELAAWFTARRETAALEGVSTGKIKLAVLPFENLNPGEDKEYFSQGLSEELITQITRIQPANLSVIARATALQFDASAHCLERMQSQLGISYVLEGKVRRSGARVRITTQLVRLEHHMQLWAETYDRDLRDVLDMQTEIAHAITKRLQVVLGLPLPVRRGETPATEGLVKTAAYDTYLKARYCMHQMSPAALRQSIVEFERALQIDPDYAPAHAGLAQCVRTAVERALRCSSAASGDAACREGSGSGTRT